MSRKNAAEEQVCGASTFLGGAEIRCNRPPDHGEVGHGFHTLTDAGGPAVISWPSAWTGTRQEAKAYVEHTRKAVPELAMMIERAAEEALARAALNDAVEAALKRAPKVGH